MQLTLIDKDMLRATIAGNTDATEQDAAHIINTVLLKQRKRHIGGECEHDQYARQVCEGMYQEKCDDVIGLCEALRAVLALAGENKEVRRVIEAAITEHGGPDVA